jgi:sec-independent protein translocase protein TatC
MTDPNDMTFMEHLKELRSRIIRMFLFAGLILICCLPFTNLIYSFISAPLMELMPAGSSMIATEVASPFSSAVEGYNLFSLDHIGTIFFSRAVGFYFSWFI